MRACGACFWCPPPSRDIVEQTGECWNRPPVVIAVPQPVDDEGRIKVQLLSARATVGLKEFCHFFRHHKEDPA